MSTHWNIEAFAVDRQNPNVLWVAQGKTTASAGSLMKYDGTNWTTLSPAGLKVSGNDDRDDSTKLFRWSGERLGVDSFMSTRVIHVSRQQGVFLSTTGGSSWSAPAGLPAYSTARTGQVVFDDRGGVVGRSTPTYVVIESLGVFTDAGTPNSFKRIDNLTPPTGKNVLYHHKSHLEIIFIAFLSLKTKAVALPRSARCGPCAPRWLMAIFTLPSATPRRPLALYGDTMSRASAGPTSLLPQVSPETTACVYP